jgi:hypothetical protein
VWLLGVVSLLALVGSAPGALGAEATPGAAASAAGRPSGPAPRPLTQLFGVACTSPASCWAVGRSGKVPLNEALHWDGRRWSPVATARPGLASVLDGVSCSAPADCWAVGYHDTPTTELNEVLHWNGRTWSLVPAPSPTATGGVSYLAGVRRSAPGNCWAVGAYTMGAAGTPVLTQALHWNGRRWSLVATPSPGGTRAGGRSGLADVRCVAPVSCWAVGDYPTGSPGQGLNLVLHWNGRKWSQARTPNPGAGTTQFMPFFRNLVQAAGPVGSGASLTAVGRQPGRGIAASRRLVYGCCGDSSTCSVGPLSTT